jgi:molybdopterin molybdotransferase
VPLTPLDEVVAAVRSAVQPLPVVDVDLADARGLVLASDVVAAESVPPFANTAMDGYAVRAADTEGAARGETVTLAVVGELAAGAAPSVGVGSGEAIRIMTGAPVPSGADAIVPVEVTSTAGDRVEIRESARPGDHVRPAGGDVTAGDLVFAAGTHLGPAHLGVLASVGVERVAVHRRLRVAVVSTGDELVERGSLGPGQIRDSNRPLLRALAADAGAEVVDLGICPDDEHVVQARIVEGVESGDALVTSGGVSVGDYDYVKAVLERLAAERGGGFRWWQVAIRPAKPFAFGTIGGVPVFGLPGNPVSSHVSFELFARPALRLMRGERAVDRPVVHAVAGEAFGRRPDGKLHLDRVRVVLSGGHFVATRSGGQGSNVLSAVAAANGLALLPDGDGVGAGEEVRVMLLGDPFPE